MDATSVTGPNQLSAGGEKVKLAEKAKVEMPECDFCFGAFAAATASGGAK